MTFSWQEETPVLLGEGISRTTAPNSKLFSIQVVFKGYLPMKETIRARSTQEALKFAHNRYPDCIAISLV
jgi:hypothetical protein